MKWIKNETVLIIVLIVEQRLWRSWRLQRCRRTRFLTTKTKNIIITYIKSQLKIWMVLTSEVGNNRGTPHRLQFVLFVTHIIIHCSSGRSMSSSTGENFWRVICRTWNVMLIFLLLISMQVAEKWNALPVYSVKTQENKKNSIMNNELKYWNFFSIHMGTFLHRTLMDPPLHCAWSFQSGNG